MYLKGGRLEIRMNQGGEAQAHEGRSFGGNGRGSWERQTEGLPDTGGAETWCGGGRHSG